MIYGESSADEYTELYNQMQPCFHVMALFLLTASVFCSIQLYRLQLTQTNTAYALTFTDSFASTPNFAFYIESATLNASQFSITYNSASVTANNISLNIVVLRQSAFISSNNEIINLAMLATDQNPLQFSVGMLQVDLSNSTTISIPNVALSTLSQVEVYSLSYPMVWTKTNDSQNIQLTVSMYSAAYAANASFAYIYYTNSFVGERVVALFQDMSETIHDYMIPYASFAFTPSAANVMLALKQYDSSSMPFMNSKLTVVYDGLNQLQVGYTFPNGEPVTFRSDVFVFNSSFAGCSKGNFLSYPVLFQTLPYSCTACHSLCATCQPMNATNPTLTDADSCLSCQFLRYLNSSSNTGNCPCYTGLAEINSVCQPCQSNCLRFKVTYVQSTTQSTFLLFYSMGNIDEQLSLQNNLLVYVDDKLVSYTANDQQKAVYSISIDLSYIDPCSQKGCRVTFYYLYPNTVLTTDGLQCLSNNNLTVIVSNIPDYYSLVPGELKQAFKILGLITAGSYMGGYSSLFKMLFELQQLIDAHKYLNLTMPIIFNQLLDNLFFFRFLDITNLIPYNDQVAIQNVVASDLDVYGPPRLMYYENGLNFYKNSITAILTSCCLLAVNLILFFVLKAIPLNFTRGLAEKIGTRKMVTVHDTLQNLQLPVMIFAISQLQLMLLRPYLIWIYGMALLLSTAALAAPFLVVVYIYNHRHLKERVNVYEDLLQDNAMSQSVTYVYYIFNFYRKIIFALALSPWLPGAVQIYVMLTLNSLHLFFQLYLIAVRAFNSKMKVIIRLIYSLCVITLEVLILIYNVGTYDSSTMINIGMACLYISITTTLLGMADIGIKLVELLCGHVQKRMKVSSERQLAQGEMRKQFQLDMKCKLGEDLASTGNVPEMVRPVDGNELVMISFGNKEENSSDCVTVKVDKTRFDVSQADLVFIDQEWMDIYPPAKMKRKSTRLDRSKEATEEKAANRAQFADPDLYVVTAEMQKQISDMEKNNRDQADVLGSLKKANKEVKASKKNGLKDGSKVVGIKTESRRQDRLIMKPILQSANEEMLDSIPLP